MNLSTVALILLAWHLLSDKAPKPSAHGWTDMLSEDVRRVIDSARKLSDKHCSEEERAGAIFEIMSNPALQNIAGRVFAPSQQPASSPQSEPSPPPSSPSPDPDVNSEGYRFETPSEASREFFRPIDDIADSEVKHKLYWFYDHWYTK